MAQTRKKRRRKHRGTQAGTIERAGRTGRPRTREEAKQISRQRRQERLDRQPTLKGAVQRAAIAAAVFGVLVVVAVRPSIRPRARSWPCSCSCSTSRSATSPTRRSTTSASAGSARPGSRLRPDGRAHVHRRAGGGEHLHLPPRRLRPRADRRPRRRGPEAAGRDRGARRRRSTASCSPTPTSTTSARSRPWREATGAEVWVPEIEKAVLADIMSFVPWPGFGPFESYDAEHTLERRRAARAGRASRSTCCSRRATARAT